MQIPQKKRKKEKEKKKEKKIPKKEKTQKRTKIEFVYVFAHLYVCMYVWGSLAPHFLLYITNSRSPFQFEWHIPIQRGRGDC